MPKFDYYDAVTTPANTDLFLVDQSDVTKKLTYAVLKAAILGSENFTTATDPALNAAVTTAIVDAYNGTVVTLTGAGDNQTLAAPTVTTAVKKFHVINNDTSTHNLSVIANGVTFTITPGEAQMFIWDLTAWGPMDMGITVIPVTVTQGGTGASTLTDHGVLVGSGTGAVTPLAVGTNGQVIVGSTGADPVFASVSGGDGIDITEGAGTLAVAVDIKANGGLVIDTTELTVDLGASAITGTLAVGDGGTGATSLTDHGLLLGSGTGAVTVLAEATNGQIPIGSTGADPVLAALTAGDGIDVTNAAGSITIAADLKANGGLVIDTTEIAVDLGASAITGTLAVTDGGTGQTSYTDGQLLIGNTTGNTLAKAELTAGDGIDVTNGAGSISIAVDLKANGGLVIDTTELTVDLGASAITGTLAVGDGGTGATTLADGGVIVGAGTGAVEVIAPGLITQMFMGGGLATNPVWTTTKDVVQVYHGIEASGALTFDNTEHTLTIAGGTNTYWYQGAEYTTAAAIVCDLDLTADRDHVSATLTANTLYYLYFKDATGKLYWSPTEWDLKEVVPVTTIFWNGSAGAVHQETHNHTRDLDWHINAHLTIGARYYDDNGLGITKPTALAPNEIDITTGYIYDEDQPFTITNPTTSRIWYQVGANQYTFVDSALPYAGADGTPQYLKTDAPYALTDVTASKYACYWVYGTGDISRPIYIIPTQATAPYNTVALARTETPPALIGMGLNPEIKLLHRFIFRGNGDFEESTDYRRVSSLPSGGVSSVAASAVTFVPDGNIAATNVQAAIEELDDEKAPIASPTFTTDITISGADAAINLKDSDCAVADVNFQVVISATDTGDGSEDIDVALKAQVAGTMVTFLNFDADGNLTLGAPGQTTAVGTLTATTINALTQTAVAVGFTIAGGTTSKTLTVALDANVAGTNTGDVTLATDSGLALANQVLNMGAPSSITGASTNSVTTSTHAHALDLASPPAIGGTTPAAGAFTTLKQTTGAADGAIPVSDAGGVLTLTASTGTGAPVRGTSPELITSYGVKYLDGHGGIITQAYYATAAITAAHTITIQTNVPAGAKIRGCQLHVKTALTDGETWNAQYVTGATQAIASTQAVAQNTNVDKFFAVHTDTDVSSDVVNITIQRSSNPGVDAFTAAGEIEAVVYADRMVAWVNE